MLQHLGVAWPDNECRIDANAKKNRSAHRYRTNSEFHLEDRPLASLGVPLASAGHSPQVIMSRISPDHPDIPRSDSSASRRIASLNGTSGVQRRHKHQSASDLNPTDGTVFSDLVYTTPGEPMAKLDVYIPPGPAPEGGRPVILAIHGGGWRKLDKRDYGRRVASAFEPKGYVVVAPDYLLSRRGRPSWPVNLQQVETAVEWIKGKADLYGIDPNRVVAMGESAGANLAELLGTPAVPDSSSAPATSPAVAAVVAFSGPSDLATLYAQSPRAGKAAAQFLGGSPSQVPGNYRAASPALREGAGGVPTFLVHGGSDPLVPVGQSLEMASALRKFGIPERLVILPGLGHDLNFPVNTPGDLTGQILEFLATTWNDRTINP
ncbi:alpha/beta hydrolase [Aquisphaera giovannonii]|uniref:alpha/beta hydrolase n=1 Tax=Aquisphaera giovannonii TaxID=406548 RepID=UPI001AEF5F1D|nr:alpha/beta hydrolase [Aquisphaera giovannonii]